MHLFAILWTPGLPGSFTEHNEIPNASSSWRTRSTKFDPTEFRLWFWTRDIRLDASTGFYGKQCWWFHGRNFVFWDLIQRRAWDPCETATLSVFVENRPGLNTLEYVVNNFPSDAAMSLTAYIQYRWLSASAPGNHARPIIADVVDTSASCKFGIQRHLLAYARLYFTGRASHQPEL